MTLADVSAPPADLASALKACAAETDAALDRLLPQPVGGGRRVIEAMRYAIHAGGKRLRPFLVLESAALFDAPRERALRVAAAIECLHTYSLVHDDLPCMDDDDLRRGRPTTHKAFDEATAVLAGDALLTFAFQLLAHPETHPDGAVRAALVARLAEAAGFDGMIGGQMMDIEAEAGAHHDREGVIQVQRMKTGALFEFSAEAGAILCARGPADQGRLRDYARDMGLAFQVADDLIDALGDVALAGKAVGKDAAAGKATFVSLYGVDGARAEASRLAKAAADGVAAFGPRAARLAALPAFLLDRTA
jgi:farnesyl diphosphate synthase